MFNRITSILLFIGLIIADEPDSGSTGSIPSIAIMDFNVIGINNADALVLTERLRSEIIDLKQFVVVETRQGKGWRDWSRTRWAGRQRVG